MSEIERGDVTRDLEATERLIIAGRICGFTDDQHGHIVDICRRHRWSRETTVRILLAANGVAWPTGLLPEKEIDQLQVELALAGEVWRSQLEPFGVDYRVREVYEISKKIAEMGVQTDSGLRQVSTPEYYDMAPYRIVNRHRSRSLRWLDLALDSRYGEEPLLAPAMTRLFGRRVSASELSEGNVKRAKMHIKAIGDTRPYAFS
jgi:hypothetical protein